MVAVAARAGGRRGGMRAGDVARIPIAQVVIELVEALGPRLVAYVGGVSHTKFVRSWREGTAAPRGRREDALRAALQATRILLAAESPLVAQAWFTGANTHLDLEAPAAVLREASSPDQVTKVVRAANAFVS
jgi:hypothetical protein